MPGNLGNNKGIDFIAKLIDYDEYKEKIEIHTIGSISEKQRYYLTKELKTMENIIEMTFNCMLTKLNHILLVFSLFGQRLTVTLLQKHGHMASQY